MRKRFLRIYRETRVEPREEVVMEGTDIKLDVGTDNERKTSPANTEPLDVAKTGGRVDGGVQEGRREQEEHGSWRIRRKIKAGCWYG